MIAGAGPRHEAWAAARDARIASCTADDGVRAACAAAYAAAKGRGADDAEAYAASEAVDTAAR